METLAQQPKLAVAAVTMTPKQQQQQQQPQQPITTTTTPKPVAGPGAPRPKRIIKAPIQILMNLKKKRQEAAAMRVDPDTSDEDITPTDCQARPNVKPLPMARTRAESNEFDDVTTITENSDVASIVDTCMHNTMHPACRMGRDDVWT